MSSSLWMVCLSFVYFYLITLNYSSERQRNNETNKKQASSRMKNVERLTKGSLPQLILFKIMQYFYYRHALIVLFVFRNFNTVGFIFMRSRKTTVLRQYFYCKSLVLLLVISACLFIYLFSFPPCVNGGL